MIGLVHELLFNFVEKNFGQEAVLEIKRQAGVPEDQEFRMDTYYPDEEWRQLLKVAVVYSGMAADEVEAAFARYSAEDLVLRFPGFFKGIKCTKDMIMRQPLIHNSLASSFSDPNTRKVIVDKFRLEEREGETVMHYVSLNKHCIFYCELAQWVAEYLGEVIEISEPLCQKRGDEECEIRIKYLGKKKAV